MNRGGESRPVVQHDNTPSHVHKRDKRAVCGLALISIPALPIEAVRIGAAHQRLGSDYDSQAVFVWSARHLIRDVRLHPIPSEAVSATQL